MRRYAALIALLLSIIGYLLVNPIRLDASGNRFWH
jgi:hypothetical protein